MAQSDKTGLIALPRSVLALIPSALHRGVLICMAERADDNGRLTITLRSFAGEIGVSYQNLRTAISKLSANAIINAKPTQRLTHITICKFESCIATTRKQQRKANATANARTNKTKVPKFTPPTDSEVAAYISKKGYHFNPEQFVPHYQKKGWMVGKSPMVDWKAACRTWEVSWKEKYGTRFYYEIQPQPKRSPLAIQADRYSALENAADTILLNAPDLHPSQDD